MILEISNHCADHAILENVRLKPPELAKSHLIYGETPEVDNALQPKGATTTKRREHESVCNSLNYHDNKKKW